MEWKQIKGHPAYEISSESTIRNASSLKELKITNGIVKIDRTSKSIDILMRQHFSSFSFDYWTDIKDYPGYKINMFGDVYSMVSDEILTPRMINGNRYCQIGRSGENKTVKSINKLVKEHFHGIDFNGEIIKGTVGLLWNNDREISFMGAIDGISEEGNYIFKGKEYKNFEPVGDFVQDYLRDFIKG